MRMNRTCLAESPAREAMQLPSCFVQGWLATP
jgi:hypothetical protein